ncbi:undecaprenyl diphosphate synthase [Oceanococcus atlanticus]|uniref:Ditrans,polycis-undecaprenyl-diphosphate synthase ((2E,6E)-farnesyl-diphosphate specific) n=1 Tax=Oceanococcus atlanticus TaxID=1317117 RepID=A0A1Y1SDF3_9GAMM|nr:isoprenyl transferase [Oceanococcus atlanticus]ORE87035.1 undecaprenyl diphosphate synthase [Oceanococcus atlanticus]RZO86788.1 MAG: isoprenyl transferase [Oceanococcus sp.]
MQDNVAVAGCPRHIAIIMDGNGRWAQKRAMPRTMGHRAGGKVARKIIEACDARGIECLTLFAFSTENWGRPKQEVGVLMDLFLSTLRERMDEFHERGARLRFIGDRSSFAEPLRAEMQRAEEQTASNSGLQLNVAVSYGGRQDIAAVARRMAEQVRDGEMQLDDITEQRIDAALALGDLPPPDLFIRTGGELRISNFLLWQLAYTELFFTDTLWPDFDEAALDKAIAGFAARERRFGGLPQAKA